MSVLPIDRLAGLRVLFGHQSVGANIIDGVRDIVSVNGANEWRVLEFEGIRQASGGFLAHGWVGENGDPRRKTQDFCELIWGHLGTHVDLALHKYCYADITAATDVDALFCSYRDAMHALRKARPRVVLVHVTVPLVRVRTGARAWVQRVVGKRSARFADNGRREQFNDLLRREYGGREPVFDLAALESRHQPRSLRQEFTDDGGHLNMVGRQHIASQLLAAVADLAAARRRL